jgi:hypothetical protein
MHRSGLWRTDVFAALYRVAAGARQSATKALHHKGFTRMADTASGNETIEVVFSAEEIARRVDELA